MKQLKYCPSLNQLTGSINATIVLLQLEYWFSKTQGKPFYKFLDVCNHDLYKAGDSWVEELGFSKAEFRSAFLKIGKVYKSKKAFDTSTDLFEGKYFASYYDRKRGLTYYIRNAAMLDALFTSKTSDTSINLKSESPISIDYNKKLTSIKYTHTSEEDVPYQSIQELFNQSCPSYPRLSTLTPKRKSLLKKLWHNMGQTIEPFKKAFLLAENSDFLSGRKGSWRASFDWLIQEDKFIALLEGSYTNPHLKTQTKTASSKFSNIYSHNWNYEELESLEEAYIETQLVSM